MKFRILLSLLGVGLIYGNPVDVEEKDNIFHYDGYKVFRTYPRFVQQFEALRKLQDEEFDFWSDISNGGERGTDIMVGPDQIARFLKILIEFNISHEIFIDDVERIIAEQRTETMKRVKTNSFDWEDYHSAEEIHGFLKQLAKDYPGLATLEIIGKTYESRDLPLLRISTGGSGKLAVFIDGNIHAREWISPAVVTYIINELVVNAHKHLDILSRFDFYIVPNLNIDGYEYSRKTQRLWRKTRSDHESVSGCMGVDGNRNFGYKWSAPGASSEKCSDVYHGQKEFSEVENDAIQKYIKGTTANWTMYLTVHSYGQYCLLPFGDGSRPNDYNDLLQKCKIFANAVFGLTGTIYTVGNSYDLLYETSGTSQDWAKGIANFKYSYTIELRDLGTFGFLLPPSQIKETGRETWTGVQAMLKSILEN